MNNTDFINQDLDDVIFEHRNRAYGAYLLRKKYGSHIKKAALVGTSLFLLLVSSPLIADKVKDKWVVADNTVVTMKDLKAIEKPPVTPPKPVIPPTPPPQKKLIATIRFSPPKVMDNPFEEPPIPKIDDITVAVSTKTQEGEKKDLPPIVEPTAPPIDEEAPKKEVKKNEEETFIFVEQQPEFKNGQKAMYEFLGKNIIYPSVARENGIEGTVYVGFVVSKDGTIRDVQVKRGIGGGCNEEAIRVIKMMPEWKAGKQNGKAVNVAFTLPVKFKLS